MIGSVVDARYELLERVSEGTFFTVFTARDRVINRLVALKLLFPRYAANAEFSLRLREEMQKAATLDHPGIARIYETGEFNGTTYVVTEYVRGTTLKERIRRSAPLPLSEAIDLAIRIGEALDYAHRSGFVHGDVTPHNAIVTPEMQVKLTDFGVNRAAAGSVVVQSNAMLRAVHYLAPEVAEGHEPTPASDTYALGVILFEMLTGTLPYNGETPLAVALKHAQEPVPSPKAVNPAVPRALEGMAMKALAKDPADRYPSALAMVRDLKRAQDCVRLGRPLTWSPLDHEPAITDDARASEAWSRPGGRDGWRIAMTVLLALIAVLVVGLGVFFVSGFGLPRDVVVPNVVGKDRNTAQAILAKAGLRMRVVQQQYSPQPAGTVLSMSPEAGRQVAEGREIRVQLSLGPEMTTVPSLANSTVPEARELLRKARLALGSVRRAHDEVVPRGLVASQDPAPDTKVPVDSRVDLVVSSGPEPVADVAQPTANEPRREPVPDRTPSRRTRPQHWEVSGQVPEDGGEQVVRIVVLQDGEEKVVYRELHAPGETFNTSVETTGEAIIRVYIGDRLTKEEAVPPPD